MKTHLTPRDILLARHVSARPALDAQRDALLARFATAESARVAVVRSPLSVLRDLFAVLHRELFAPYRRAWHALACVWIALLTVQQFDRLTASSLTTRRPADSVVEIALLTAWIEQRRQLAAASGLNETAATIAPEKSRVSRPLGAIESRPLSLAFV